MVEAYKKFLSNYANFNGRSTRSDYWYVVLMNILIGAALTLLSDLSGLASLISKVYSIVTLIPMIAIVVRRLHDINKSGWFYLLALIPLVGPIILLVFLCTPSVNENNSYGERV